MSVSINGDNGLTFNDGSTQTTSPFTGGFGFRNRIINGDMRIDQRNNGSSVTLSTTTQFPVDRFAAYKGTSGATVTAQRSTTAPAGFINSIIFTASTGATPAAGDINGTWQSIEGLNVSDLGWGTANAQSVTLSFWVRSSVTGTYSISFANAAVNRFYVATYSISSANTWEQKTVTIAGDTSGTWATDNTVGIQIVWDLGYGTNFNGTAGAWGSSTIRRTSGSVQLIATTGATFYITGVQLEKGSTATSFDYRPYGTELMLCQRYAIVYGRDQVYNEIGGTGFAYGTADTNIPVAFPVQMRTTPTLSTSGNFQVSDGASATAITAMSIITAQSSSLIASVRGTVASGLTVYRPYRIETNNSTTATATFSAEL